MQPKHSNPRRRIGQVVLWLLALVLLLGEAAQVFMDDARSQLRGHVAQLELGLAEWRESVSSRSPVRESTELGKSWDCYSLAAGLMPENVRQPSSTASIPEPPKEIVSAMDWIGRGAERSDVSFDASLAQKFDMHMLVMKAPIATEWCARWEAQQGRLALASKRLQDGVWFMSDCLRTGQSGMTLFVRMQGLLATLLDLRLLERAELRTSWEDRVDTLLSELPGSDGLVLASELYFARTLLDRRVTTIWGSPGTWEDFVRFYAQEPAYLYEVEESRAVFAALRGAKRLPWPGAVETMRQHDRSGGMRKWIAVHRATFMPRHELETYLRFNASVLLLCAALHPSRGLPIDPFHDGKMRLQRRHEEGMEVLWSVGIDGVDHGGIPAAGSKCFSPTNHRDLTLIWKTDTAKHAEQRDSVLQKR